MCSTSLACQLVAFLPQSVASVPVVALVIELVDTLALNKVEEGSFVCSFVDVEATGSASQVTFGLLQGVLTLWLLSCLLGQEVGNDLCSG